jgi:hypothetical protein
MARYLIPKPIAQRYELFPGWGLAQVGLVGAGVVAGGVLFAGISLVHGPVALRLMGVLLPTALAGFLAFPPPNEPPLYQRLLAGWRYRQQTQRFLYDWTAGDDPAERG